MMLFFDPWWTSNEAKNFPRKEIASWDLSLWKLAPLKLWHRTPSKPPSPTPSKRPTSTPLKAASWGQKEPSKCNAKCTLHLPCSSFEVQIALPICTLNLHLHQNLPSFCNFIGLLVQIKLLERKWHVEFALQKCGKCGFAKASANRGAIGTWTVGVEVQIYPPEKSHHQTPVKTSKSNPLKMVTSKRLMPREAQPSWTRALRWFGGGCHKWKGIASKTCRAKTWSTLVQKNLKKAVAVSEGAWPERRHLGQFLLFPRGREVPRRGPTFQDRVPPDFLWKFGA